MPIGSSLRMLMGGGVIPLEDTFSRGDGAMGSTEVGGAGWVSVYGTWSILNQRAYTSTSRNNNPIVVVDGKTANATVSTTIAPYGGDSLYFRVVDHSNWIRLRQRYWSTSSSTESTTCDTCETKEYGKDCGVTSTSSSCSGATCNDQFACGYCPDCSGSCCGDVFGGCVQQLEVCDTYDCNCTTTTTWTTSYHYRVYFEKCVAGSITLIASWSGGFSNLKAVMDGTSITPYLGGNAQSAYTVTEHATATKHGIGRGPSDLDSGTNLDNFVFTPIQ